METKEMERKKRRIFHSDVGETKSHMYSCITVAIPQSHNS